MFQNFMINQIPNFRNISFQYMISRNQFSSISILKLCVPFCYPATLFIILCVRTHSGRSQILYTQLLQMLIYMYKHAYELPACILYFVKKFCMRL